MPRCGALSLLQKDAALQGRSSRNRCRLHVEMCVLRDDRWWDLTAFSTRNLKAATRKLKADEGQSRQRAPSRQACRHTISPRQRCRRPTPRFCAAGANCKNMCRCWSARRNATANPLFAGEIAGVGFASILRTLLPAAPPASPVSPARGIIERV